MRTGLMALLALAAVAGAARFAGAALTPIDAQTWSDDFEGADLDGWGLPDYYRLTQLDGNGVLEVGGPSTAEMDAVKLAYPGVGPAWGDYAVQVRVRHQAGSWAGLYFRKGTAGHFEAFIWGQRMLIRRQPGAIVLSQAPLPPSDDPWRTLRIVGLGPSIRVYVDDAVIFACTDDELTAGTSGIASHSTHAFYDDFAITDRLRPEETLFVRPDAPEDGLIVPPSRPATINLDAWNAAGEARQVEVGWSLDEEAPTTQTVTLAGGERRLLPLEPGALAEGIHWLELSVAEGGRQYPSGRFPVAAVTPPDVGYEEPFFAWGVYDKYELGGEAWALNTYLHAMCNDLRRHGFNTIMAGNTMPRPSVTQLDILARYGVKVILRGLGELPPEVTHHPAVLAIAYGDEPTVDDLESYRARFDELAERYGKPITSCLIGDSVGTRTPADPWLIWPELGSPFKLARYYPIRKSVYDLVRFPNYKGGLSPQAIFRLLEIGAGADGWYYVIQAFGDNLSAQTPEPYWRNPSAAEIRGLAHLALAHGTRGVIAYTYQTERPNWPALVDQQWQRPTDGKYEALAKVAEDMAPVRELLLGSAWEATEVRCWPVTVWPVGRKTADGRQLVYLVNLDTDAAADARVEIVDPVVGNARVPVAWVRDLRAGTELPREHEGMRTVLSVHLEPGDGALLEFGMQ